MKKGKQSSSQNVTKRVELSPTEEPGPPPKKRQEMGETDVFVNDIFFGPFTFLACNEYIVTG
jgi:hypothetical protein